MLHCHWLKCFLSALVYFVGAPALQIQTTSAFVPSSRTRTSRATSTAPTAPNDIRRPVSTTILSASPSDQDDDDTKKSSSLPSEVRRAFLASSLAALSYNAFTLGAPALGLFLPPGYERISPLQFIAALGDPDASSGNGAERWGLWTTDPGPQGLRLRDYERIMASESAQRPSWLDSKDFFLDENAIIMPQPEFPMPPGKYLVTGARSTTTGLTIDAEGNWKLDEGKLFDVTHLPCRAARYRTTTTAEDSKAGSPMTVRRGDFPVMPGGIMPDVPGTNKEIYSVVFIIGKQSV